MAAPEDFLIERFIEGTLDPDEDAALAQLLETQPGLPGQVTAHIQMDLMLRVWGERLAPAQRLGAAVQERLTAAQHGSRVRRAVVRRLTSPPNMRSRRVIWGGLAAAATLFLAGGLLVMGLRTPASPPMIAVLELSGTAFIDSSSRVREARAGEALADGERLRSWADSRAVVTYPGEATRISLDPSSTVRFSVGEGGKRIALEDGGLNCSVALQPAGKPLTLSTPHADLTVLGTRFHVTVANSGTHLTVDSGRVRFVDRATGVEDEVTDGGSRAAGLDAIRTVETRGDAGSWLAKSVGGASLRPIVGAATTTDGDLPLELAYTPGEAQWSWAWVERPQVISATDASIRFRLQVEQADPGARLDVTLGDQDGDNWVMQTVTLTANPGAWQDVVIPILPASKTPPKHTWIGDSQYDPETTVRMGLCCYGGRITLRIAGLSIISKVPNADF